MCRCGYTRSADGLHFDSQRALSGKSKGLDGGIRERRSLRPRCGGVARHGHTAGRKPPDRLHREVCRRRGVVRCRCARDNRPGRCAADAAGCVRCSIGLAHCTSFTARPRAMHSHRDTTWLMIQGVTPRPPVRVDPWDLQSCPMSTFALAESSDGLVAAWETAQQIHSATLNPKDGSVGPIVSVPGKGSRKHPSVAVNANGDRLIAWAEGTAWNRGGTVAWRLTDRSGKEIGSSENAGPVPVWGLVSSRGAA